MRTCPVCYHAEVIDDGYCGGCRQCVLPPVSESTTDAPFVKNKYREFRKDGWPLCPACGEDELYSLSIPASADAITGCYRCNFTPDSENKSFDPRHIINARFSLWDNYCQMQEHQCTCPNPSQNPGDYICARCQCEIEFEAALRAIDVGLTALFPEQMAAKKAEREEEEEEAE